MMTPEFSRTAGIAVNMGGMTFEERQRLRAALIEAQEYGGLDAWASAKYDAAHVLYLRKFGASPDAPGEGAPGGGSTVEG
jgi:hypothetical protein